MPTCPAGHQTVQTDFCDTCGLPIGAEAAPEAPSPEAAPAAGPIVCPQCQTANVADALFCEACGFDFISGVAPEHLASQAAWPEAPQATPPAEATDESGATPAVIETPAEATGPLPAAPPAATPAPSSADAPAKPVVTWVAELWIDPDWYAAQGSSDPLPSPGLPDIVALVKQSNLIGRVSQSRGIFPDVDCELDTGCSRRHAMLTTDDTRWWIEDLNSANGTFVGSAAGPLPAMPIPQGRVELTQGQRIYVGAWTRIVVRRATADEQAAFAD